MVHSRENYLRPSRHGMDQAENPMTIQNVGNLLCSDHLSPKGLIRVPVWWHYMEEGALLPLCHGRSQIEQSCLTHSSCGYLRSRFRLLNSVSPYRRSLHTAGQQPADARTTGTAMRPSLHPDLGVVGPWREVVPRSSRKVPGLRG